MSQSVLLWAEWSGSVGVYVYVSVCVSRVWQIYFHLNYAKSTFSIRFYLYEVLPPLPRGGGSRGGVGENWKEFVQTEACSWIFFPFFLSFCGRPLHLTRMTIKCFGLYSFNELPFVARP